MSLAAFLTTIVQALEEASIPYMLTGSLAGAYYALPRSTQDVDLVLEPSRAQLDVLVEALLSRGMYVSREAAHEAYRFRGQFNAIDPEVGWKVDLILRKERPFSVEEFARRRYATILGIEVSLTSLEDLILAKLEWARMGDSDLQRRDVTRLIESGWRSLDHAYITRWTRQLGLEREYESAVERASIPEEGSE